MQDCTGMSPIDAATLLAKPVSTLSQAFIGEDAQFAMLFTLDNATVTDAIADFNAALFTTRRKNTLGDEEVMAQFIAALDANYYQLVVSVLFVAARPVRTLADKVNGKGFTPRAGKPFLNNNRRMKTRLTAETLSQSGGKPEIFEDISACPFAVGDCVQDDVSKHT
ncbi:hypothetical protein CYMTET_16576 [Cymbomonas tetramitiformis]|uniref:Uncharacterized protein n=1 Tax=Cymbomonas tetramitiformis TaxID=36881 RepID=A0AAE0GC45_9CHLO|nr:hypothetical protein CYMTET_16576 [Cymbomonas tetramitiformis]